MSASASGAAHTAKPTLPSQAELDREWIRRKGLRGFVEAAWSLVEPEPYQDNWHVGLICEYLEAATNREIHKLAINQPPGTTKSMVVSVLWPAWEWTFRPTEKTICATYERELARRDAIKHRSIVNSDWYRATWGTHIPYQNTRSATWFTNNCGGWRYSTSVNGAVTGRHANKVVWDDPIKPVDAEGRGAVSRVEIDTAISKWRGTFSTRLLPDGLLVLLMQRLHEEDPVGYALSHEDDWVHVRLPMRWESAPCPVTRVHVCVPDKRVKEGELLWPERFPERVVAEREGRMGPRVTAAQYQQRPSPAAGGIFRREWFRHRYRRAELPRPDQGTWAMAWDCAFKGTATSDYVAGAVGCMHEGKLYLAHVRRGRWGFEETCEQVEDVARAYPQAWTKVVEDAANGAAVVEVLGKRILGLRLVKPEGGKEARWHSVEPFWAAGNVLLPEDDEADWDVGGLEEEHCAAGVGGANDDRVDAVTHLIRVLCGTDFEAYAAYVQGLTS